MPIKQGLRLQLRIRTLLFQAAQKDICDNSVYIYYKNKKPVLKDRVKIEHICYNFLRKLNGLKTTLPQLRWRINRRANYEKREKKTNM